MAIIDRVDTLDAIRDFSGHYDGFSHSRDFETLSYVSCLDPLLQFLLTPPSGLSFRPLTPYLDLLCQVLFSILCRRMTS